jgi:hypothetical protein
LAGGSALVHVQDVKGEPLADSDASNNRNVEAKLPSGWSQSPFDCLRIASRTAVTPDWAVAEPEKVTGERMVAPEVGLETRESGSTPEVVVVVVVEGVTVVVLDVVVEGSVVVGTGGSVVVRLGAAGLPPGTLSHAV